MSYANSKCPCGDEKAPCTMLCDGCMEAFAEIFEMVIYLKSDLDLNAKRSAAIKLLAMASVRNKSVLVGGGV